KRARWSLSFRQTRDPKSIFRSGLKRQGTSSWPLRKTGKPRVLWWKRLDNRRFGPPVKLRQEEATAGSVVACGTGKRSGERQGRVSTVDEVVIVGGGVGGTVTANLLAEELAPEIAASKVRIRLITDRPEHIYKPAFLYAAFGRTAPRAYRRPQRELLHPAVELVVDPVNRIDAGQRQVIGESGKSYDSRC